MSSYYEVVYDQIFTDDTLRNSLESLLCLALKAAPVSMAAIAFPYAAHMYIFNDGQITCVSINESNELVSGYYYKQLLVEDLTTSEKYANNTLAAGTPNIRFFASAPVMNSKTGLIGHLCIMHKQALAKSDVDMHMLNMLAGQLAVLWEARMQIAVLQDIENQNRRLPDAEAILEKQKVFYEHILNSLPVDIAVFDTDHKYLFVNPGAISDRMLRAYIIGKDDFEYCSYRNRDTAIAERRRAMFMDIKNTGKTIKWEDNIIDPTGETRTYLRRFFPVYGAHGDLKMVIGLGMEITDRKKLEEKQTVLLNQHMTRNTQLLDFCNIISHNLRAPIGNIGMIADLLEENGDMQLQRELLGQVKPLVGSLQTTLDELLASIQVSRNTELERDDNDIEAYLHKTMTVLQVDITRSAAAVSFDFSSAPRVKFPSRYLDSLLLNLVSNALKYQSRSRTLVLRINTVRDGSSIILSVSDNGLGIDLKRHGDNIFKIGKVFHAHPEAKGFGLYMTKCQVDAMDGEIWVESEPDKGATFFVRFNHQD